ncbi:ubiquitin-conjugating enzyme [Hamiltosporidium tvaerminnensis]|uniref:Ubiquitin-conjugating enzyme n=1 Tax=Hamiltosporidium tvaerminnensis TaxID=1176355 RepID=A0A4Q9KZR3_9MICR|nr:ubiquitin-conjugating enzyme [Hamiltosporidium tvaerminnensis]
MISANERLLTERNNLRKDRKYLFFGKPIKNEKKIDLLNWNCGFPGPLNDLYKNSYFQILLSFPKNYPLSPPKAFFKNFVYHPNVYTNGQVCLDILTPEKWKPTMNILQILLSIQHLLISPNIHSPANGTSCSVYMKNKFKYEEEVKNNIKKYHSKIVFE